MAKKILLVDDEQAVLRAFSRCFLFSDYPVYLADSGEKALEILESEDINLIISDIRMPGMDGYTLLKKVKKDFPHVIRIILSGYADENILVKAFQKNLAKMYLLKPWNNNELQRIINNIFDLEEKIKEKNIPIKLQHLEDLPTLESAFQKFERLIEDEASMDEIAEVLKQDQVMAARILRVVNSAFFQIKTGSVKDALIYLGLVNTKHILLSTSVYEGLEDSFTGGYSRKTLWKHANLSNRIVTTLYRKLLKKEIPKTHATAGLLHDLGRVFLIKQFGKNYPQPSSENQKSLLSREQQALGINHAEIGAYLLNWWESPLPIIEAAMFHHRPLEEKIINKELVALVHIADYFSSRFLDSKNENPLYPQIFQFFGLGEEELFQMLKKNLWK